MLFKTLKVLYYVLRELVFDNKEEYDFNSPKFNARKFIVTMMMLFSFSLNTWLLYRFTVVAMNNVVLLKKCRSTEVRTKSPQLNHLIGE